MYKSIFYLCAIFFGIIIYLLWNAKDGFSVGIPACISHDVSSDTSNCPDGCNVVDASVVIGDNICIRNSLNWFSDDNQYGTAMIPKTHFQGGCGTCSIYSIIYVFECMYNISKRNVDPQFVPISISPQSLIDIFGRYNSKINFCFSDSNPAWSTNYYSDSENCYCNGGNSISQCGMDWICNLDNMIPNTILYNFAKLKTLDNDKFSAFNFSYPLIKDLSMRKDDKMYVNNFSNDSCFEKQGVVDSDTRILFNERSLDVIKDENYLYTDYFQTSDIIDFHFTWDRIFGLNFSAIGVDAYTNELKKQLNNGPILINITVNDDYSPDEKNSILEDNELRNFLTNHSITIVGYKEIEGIPNIYILNTWNDDIDFTTHPFEDLYNCHILTINNIPPLTLLAYNYIYISVFTDINDLDKAYNPNTIQKYMTSCGTTWPLILAGVSLVSLTTMAYRNRNCLCNRCSASPYATLDVSVPVTDEFP